MIVKRTKSGFKLDVNRGFAIIDIKDMSDSKM